MKLVCKLRIKNALGLHARPATVIVKLLQDCKSHVLFSHKREEVNAKSIMSLLMLAAKKDSQIVATIEGEDAEETMKKLIAVFDDGFGE